MSYWHTRDTTERLIANRRERQCERDDGYSAFEAMMDRLPLHLVEAINDYFEGNELITQTRIEDGDV